MSPFRNDAEREKSLFSLATELGLIDLGDQILASLPKSKEKQENVQTESKPHSVQNDFSRLT